MNVKGFNPYKAFSTIYKLFNQYGNGESGYLTILGTSGKVNGWEFNDQVEELIDVLKERGFETIKNLYEKPHPDHMLFEVFDPYSIIEVDGKPSIEKKVDGKLVNTYYHKRDKLYFIGCPHDYIKDINFSSQSIVIDIWGIVEDRDDLKIIRKL